MIRAMQVGIHHLVSVTSEFAILSQISDFSEREALC